MIGQRLRSRRSERGQVIVLLALMGLVLFGLAALAFDLSLAMADRRDLQAESDNAALAGAASYSTSANAAHWVTLQYLQKPLNFALPQGTCTSSSACPAGTYTVGKYTVTIADPGSKQLDLSIQHQEPAILASLIGAGVVTTGSSVRTMAPGPTVFPITYGAVALGGDLGVYGGGGSVRNFGNSVYAQGNFGGNNGPHADGVPQNQTNYDGTACPGPITNKVDVGGGSNSMQWGWTSGSGATDYSVPVPTDPFASAAPTISGPTYTTTAAAKDGSGNWKPGIYNGIYPSAPGKLNPGVFKLINVTTAMNFGALTNTIYTAAGTEDTNGAAAIVLDNTDTGAIDISAVTLNGLDDLHPQSYSGPRDPQGTHNFAFYGGTGASAYTATVDWGPGANINISGIFDMPGLTVTSHGSSSWTFTGQLTVNSISLSGGGSATQSIQWVCGLQAVLGNPAVQAGLNR